MSNRKPLDLGCNGSVTCTVPEHVRTRRHRNGWEFSHIPLTFGQRKTLDERRREAETSAKETR